MTHIAPPGDRRLRMLASEGERGQAIVIIVLFLAVLLGMAAMVIDVGYAYYTHRSLQASADAAALAGAMELPDSNRAQAIARDYGAAPGGKNQRDNISNVSTSVSTKCIASVPGCDPVNAITVKEHAVVDTMFAKVLGVGHFDVSAKSIACSPCGVRPLDVMLVLDRTGSMCQTHSGANDPACTDLNNARDGMKTFLGYMDAPTQWVGLGVLPPATSIGNKCTTPDTPNYNSTSAKYTIVPLSSDYAVGGQLKATSNLVSTINCQKGGGRTAYANALEEAQKELNLHGRTGVQDIIVFLSDGAANIGPTYYSTSSPYRKQPCHQGIWSAAPIKTKGTIIYSIGYDLDALNGGANTCETWDDRNESPAITAYQALEGIASGPGNFYNKPSAGQLRTIFTAIAADISRGSAALIDESVQ